MLTYGNVATGAMFLGLALEGPSASVESAAALIGRIADDQDAAALESLYDRYARPVYAVLLRVLGDRGLADELQQEVFLKLWRNAQQFDRGRPW